MIGAQAAADLACWRTEFPLTTSVHRSLLQKSFSYYNGQTWLGCSTVESAVTARPAAYRARAARLPVQRQRVQFALHRLRLHSGGVRRAARARVLGGECGRGELERKARGRLPCSAAMIILIRDTGDTYEQYVFGTHGPRPGNRGANRDVGAYSE